MKARWVWCLAGMSAAAAVFGSAEWEFTYRAASAKVAMYGGGLGDPVKPTPKDTKVAFELTGRAAQDLFAAIGPDRVDRCGGQPGERFRSRDEDRLVCTRSAAGEHRCHFGFDLSSGRSIGGSIC